jgi:adenylate kinase
MRILMVAAPGAGKGTQAERLAGRYSIEHPGSDIGRAAEVYVRRGDLVPDELVMRLVLDRVITAARNGGYVLDGFPRNRGQAEAAAAMVRSHPDLSLDAVVHLEVARDELRRRMLARAATDDRSDDRASVIDHRLEVYDAQTQPLLEYYEDRGILVDIDGSLPVDEVTAALIAALDARVARAHKPV